MTKPKAMTNPKGLKPSPSFQSHISNPPALRQCHARSKACNFVLAHLRQCLAIIALGSVFLGNFLDGCRVKIQKHSHLYPNQLIMICVRNSYMHSCSGLRLEFPEVQGVPNVRGDQVIWRPWFVLKLGAVPGGH